MRIKTRRQKIRDLTEQLKAAKVALEAAKSEQGYLAAELRRTERRRAELNDRIMRCSAVVDYDDSMRERIKVSMQLDPFVLFSYPAAERQKYIDWAVQRMLRQLNEHLLQTPGCMR
jgi:hypothetical protein